MKSNELSIGNYLLKDGKIVEVAVINADNTIRIWNEEKTNTLGCYRLTEFDTIKITKENLLRLCFEFPTYNTDEVYLKKDGISIVFELDEDGFFYTAGEGIKLSRQLKYVHEVQNLVYELGRIELTLK